jgi:SPP1 family predicted phage head-tail adaptor
MRAGKLNKRVALQSLQDGQDEIGQPVQTWQTFATVWANVRNLNGLETVKADADTSIVKASIRLRLRRDLDQGMRALLGSIVYEIEAVLPDEGGDEYVDLVCKVINA